MSTNTDHRLNDLAEMVEGACDDASPFGPDGDHPVSSWGHATRRDFRLDGLPRFVRVTAQDGQVTVTELTVGNELEASSVTFRWADEGLVADYVLGLFRVIRERVSA
jgi:hypothetical protein